MGIFYYKAKRGLNDDVNGTVDAEDQSDALFKIEQLGLIPLCVTRTPVVDGQQEDTLRRNPVKKGSRVTAEEILAFVKKLTTLSRARVELLSSLRILYEQTQNPVFQSMILDLYNTTKEGRPFSYSLLKYPKVFSPLFVNIIKAGEASGRLDTSFEQISDFMTREQGLRNKIRIALAYPMLLSVVGLSSVFILLNFVVPRLRPILEGMGSDLPLITKCVLQLSVFVNKSWLACLVLCIISVLILYMRKGQEFLYRSLMRAGELIPVVRRLIKSQELAYFTQALALLLKSGIPALKAFEIALETIEDAVMRQELTVVCRHIAAGETISKSLMNHTHFPDFFIKMIAIGEESGRLIEVLDEIAASYRQQIETDLAVVTSLLEPFLILFIGVIMGGIVLAILLPTFQITQFIR
jgi:general secretion pathway protein F